MPPPVPQSVSEMLALINGLQLQINALQTRAQLISSGSIIGPVQFFDITLPPVFPKFQLSLFNLVFDNAGAAFVSSFSPDGGTTFICDTTHHDSYFTDQGARTNATIGGDLNVNADLIINPGSSVAYPYHSFVRFSTVAQGSSFNGSGGGGLNAAATVPPGAATRQNLLRFATLANENNAINPPVDGLNILSGSWTLSGYPNA
jgi:hypothetical protein